MKQHIASLAFQQEGDYVAFFSTQGSTEEDIAETYFAGKAEYELFTDCVRVKTASLQEMGFALVLESISLPGPQQ